MQLEGEEKTDWTETTRESMWGEGRSQDDFEFMLVQGCPQWGLEKSGGVVRKVRGSL